MEEMRVNMSLPSKFTNTFNRLRLFSSYHPYDPMYWITWAHVPRLILPFPKHIWQKIIPTDTVLWKLLHKLGNSYVTNAWKDIHTHTFPCLIHIPHHQIHSSWSCNPVGKVERPSRREIGLHCPNAWHPEIQKKIIITLGWENYLPKKRLTATRHKRTPRRWWIAVQSTVLLFKSSLCPVHVRARHWKCIS